MELMAFDRLVRWQPSQEPDDRLLIVGIVEQDIQTLNRWPLSDETVAETLRSLQEHQPTAIALDLVRDIPNPPGHEELIAELQKPNVISITNIGNSEFERVSPPSGISIKQIGFSDIPTDADGRVRRNLMFASNGETTLPSLSLQGALLYLEKQGIAPGVREDNQYQLGKAVFTKLKSHSGGYQRIDARGYQILLDYRSPTTPARQVTLTEVLSGEVNPDWIRDKIVFVGVIAPSLKDLFFTPYSAAAGGHRKMPGVVLHAQMTGQLISAARGGRRLFWFWSEPVELFWIFLWSLLGGIVAWRVRHPLSLGGSVVLLLLVLCGIGWGAFFQKGWIPMAAPMLGFLGTGASVVLYQMQTSWQQEQMVMKLLGQQTSPEIASALWKNRDRLLDSGKLPWQTVTATVLFTDLKGFSTVSEKMSSQALMVWLNEYLSAMTEEVVKHNGIVNKFTGDGMMAAFGVPVSRKHLKDIARDARNAVACALAMGDRLAQLNPIWQERGLPAVQMRVGIFTGLVTAGSLGGKDRLEYGIIGDTVNSASRLESCEKHRQDSICRVLVAKETLVYLQGEFKVETWGELKLQGKQKPVEVFLISGYSNAD